MLDNQFDPVFILGVPRSGTTLLRTLLGSHSEVIGAPETGWITGGYGNFSLRELVESLSTDPIGAVENLKGVDEEVIYESTRLFLASIFSKYISKSGKTLLVLKTPDDIRYLDFLDRLFPAARYIHIYRDGRDVACSTYRQKGHFFGDGVLQEYGDLTVLNALRRWVDWEVKVRRFLDRKGVKFARCSYEQLVNEPKAILSSLCQFLNLSFEDGMIDYQNYDHAFPDWEAGSEDVKRKAHIDQSSIGKWQKEISVSQWKKVDVIAGDMLESLKYATCEQEAKNSQTYLLSALEEKETRVIKLSAELITAQQELEGLAVVNQSYSQQIESIAELEAELSNMKQILQGREKEIDELESQLTLIQELSEKKDDEIVRLTLRGVEENRNWLAKQTRQEAEINQKGKTIIQLNTQLSSLETTVRQLDEEKHLAVKRVFESSTFRVGKFITSPARLVKKIVVSQAGNVDATDKNNITANVVNGFDLGQQLTGFYGKHRSGWSYAVASLASLQNPDGLYLDTFIEKTFVWAPAGVKPHKRPWVGFIHVPPNVPEWFQYEQSNQAIFDTPAWKESLPYCRGLFTLSQYHKKELEKHFDFPIESLVHPTEIPEKIWDWDNFEKNPDKKIIQLGWWLRKLHAIYQLPKSQYRKIFLKVTEQQYMQDLLDKEKQLLINAGEFDESMYSTVDVVSYLPDEEYDNWLSENIGFLNIYDSSANNAVIECIARGTPLLVNPIEPIVEYLGIDYPFYYSSFEEAVHKASDFALVKKTHEYLISCPVRAKLSGDYFRKCLAESEILSGLK